MQLWFGVENKSALLQDFLLIVLSVQGRFQDPHHTPIQTKPKRVREESERVSRGLWPQSPQRVRPGVRKESKRSPKLRFWTLFGLRGALFGDSGAPRRRRPGTPFRTLSGLFWGSGPKGPRALCAARGFLLRFFQGEGGGCYIF